MSSVSGNESNSDAVGAAAASGASPQQQQRQQQQQQQQQRLHPPSFHDDPAGYLRHLCAVTVDTGAGAASYAGGGGGLANPVASSMKDATLCTPEVAALFLQAAANHLRLEANKQQAQAVQPQPSAAVGRGGAAGRPGPAGPMNDGLTSKQVQEVVEAVGHAVTRTASRSVITQSGILPVLAVLSGLAPSSTLSSPSIVSSHSSSSSLLPLCSVLTLLTPVQVEFLQACIYAEQYRYAERLVGSTWPRPHSSSTSVRHVLRYFYLRGTVHIGCSNFMMARRCFWTCLSIPSEMVSSVVVAAWKKLVLCQCLLLVDQTGPDTMTKQTPRGTFPPASWAETSPFRIPDASPSCFTRFLHTALEPPQRQQQQMACPEEESMHVVENIEADVVSQQASGGRHHPILTVKVYRDLARAFMDIDRPLVDEIIERKAAIIQADGNWGLVQQISSQLYRRQIYLASRLYKTIPLERLAQQLGGLPLTQLQNLLLELSFERSWPIELDDAGWVHFPKQTPTPLALALFMDNNNNNTAEPESGNGSGGSADSAAASCLYHLVRMVQELDVTMASSPKYATLLKRELAGDGRLPQPRGVEDV